MSVRLSICIPTYNRAVELQPLLDSIAAQSGHGLSVEVVISDNASTDGTQDLVQRYIAAGMSIVYARLPENRGFDRNVLNVIDLASGEHCWLFGSDDLLEPGALAKVEDVFNRYPDLTGISVGSQGYSPDLSQRVFVTDNVSTAFTAETLLRGREEPIARIGPWMGYMTSMIVRRLQWQQAVRSAPITPYLKGYVHLYVAARMLDERSAWLCVPDRLVGCRVNNDSFIAVDEFARTRLDIEGFDLAFGDTLGRNNWAYHRATSMVAAYFVRSHFMSAKMRGASWRYWRQAVPMTLSVYWKYPTFWIKAVPVAITPRPLFLLARFARQRVRRQRQSS